MRRCLRDPTFSRFDTVPECVRQTHTHTQRHTDTRRRHIPRLAWPRAVKNQRTITNIFIPDARLLSLGQGGGDDPDLCLGATNCPFPLEPPLLTAPLPFSVCDLCPPWLRIL